MPTVELSDALIRKCGDAYYQWYQAKHGKRPHKMTDEEIILYVLYAGKNQLLNEAERLEDEAQAKKGAKENEK